MDAIIGNTGFVGGHLIRQHLFEGQFNTRNINESEEGSFSTVVCAAAPGSMFEANKFPDLDYAKIENLIDKLAKIEADTFVLISSIAVLENYSGQDDEGTEAFQTNTAYGRNRRELEVFCASNFKRCSILRLPALYGMSLKKNFLFDLLNPIPTMLTETKFVMLRNSVPRDLVQTLTRAYSWNDAVKMYLVDRVFLLASGQLAALVSEFAERDLTAVHFTNPQSSFQFYNINGLWSDIEICLSNNLPLLHLAPEPVSAGLIHERLIGRQMPDTGARVHCENMYTRYAKLWNRTGCYMDDSESVLDKVEAFFCIEKARHEACRI